MEPVSAWTASIESVATWTASYGVKSESIAKSSLKFHFFLTTKALTWDSCLSCFLLIDVTSRHPDSFFWREARKHGKEIDVNIFVFRGFGVGVLELRAVVLCENDSRGASHCCSNQGANLAGISGLVIEICFVEKVFFRLLFVL